MLFHSLVKKTQMTCSGKNMLHVVIVLKGRYSDLQSSEARQRLELGKKNYWQYLAGIKSTSSGLLAVIVMLKAIKYINETLLPCTYWHARTKYLHWKEVLTKNTMLYCIESFRHVKGPKQWFINNLLCCNYTTGSFSDLCVLILMVLVRFWRYNNKQLVIFSQRGGFGCFS